MQSPVFSIDESAAASTRQASAYVGDGTSVASTGLESGLDTATTTGGGGGGDTALEALIEEAIDFEVQIDLAKLRELCAHGIPSRLRAKVYPLLLAVAPVDKSEEMTTMRDQQTAFAVLLGDQTNGRRLRRFLASTLGSGLPCDLRRKLEALAAVSGLPPASAPGSRDAASMGVAAASTGTSAVTGSVVGGVGGGASGFRSAGGERASAGRSSMIVQRGSSRTLHPHGGSRANASTGGAGVVLQTVEALLSAHVGELSSASYYVRGVDTQLLPAVYAPRYTGLQGSTAASSEQQVWSDNMMTSTSVAKGTAANGASGASPNAGGGQWRLVEPHDRRATQHIRGDVEQSSLVWQLSLALVLGGTLDSSTEAYFCTESMFAQLTRDGSRSLWTSTGLRDATAFFVMVLRHGVEDLYDYLYELGVNHLEWVPSLLASLFLDRMPTDMVLQLLDYYVTTFDYELHPYVCCAVLEAWMEELLDAELDGFLELMAGPWEPNTIPPMASLLRAATKMREEMRARKLV